MYYELHNCYTLYRRTLYRNFCKIEFRRLTDQLLESDSENIDPELEKKIELLLHFLKNSDFNKLRASDERLSGVTPGICIIGKNSSGLPVIKSIS